MTLVSNTFSKPSKLNNNLDLDLDPNYLVNNKTLSHSASNRKTSETENVELSNFINKVNFDQQRETFKRILFCSVFIISTLIFVGLFFYFENQTRQQTIFIQQTNASANQVDKS